MLKPDMSNFGDFGVLVHSEQVQHGEFIGKAYMSSFGKLSTDFANFQFRTSPLGPICFVAEPNISRIRFWRSGDSPDLFCQNRIKDIYAYSPCLFKGTNSSIFMQKPNVGHIRFQL